MSVTGEPDGAAGEVRRAAGRFLRRPVRARSRSSRRCAQAAGDRRGHAYRRADARRDARHRRAADLASTSAAGATRRQLGSAHPRNAPYQAFRSRGRLLRHGGRQQRAVAVGLRGRSDARSCWPTSASPRRRCAPSTRTRCWRSSSTLRAGDTARLAAALPRRRRAVRADQQLLRRCWPIRRCEHMGWVQPHRRCRTASARAPSARRCASPARACPICAAPPPALGEHNAEVLGPLRATAVAPMSERAATSSATARRWTFTLERGPTSATRCRRALVEALHRRRGRARMRRARALLVFRGEGRNFSAGFDFGGVEAAERGRPAAALRAHRAAAAGGRAASPCLTLALAHGRNFGAGVDLVGACRAAHRHARTRASACRG